MLKIIICDDCSIDNTLKIAQLYAKKYSNIKVFQRETNGGMDRNFADSALHATGKYIWFCGQDDIFQPGAITKAIAILEDDRTVDMIYFNHTLQNRLFEFFYDNLHEDGSLVIGRHEGILGSIASKFKKKETIYIKKPEELF